MLLCWGRALVALKMEKLVESIDKTMREQLKLTPRSANLAIRTRVLIFYERLMSATDGDNRHSVHRELLTKSLACSFSVDSSRFSRISSSRNVGLRGLLNLAGVPGTLKALLRGDLGVIGTVMDSRLSLCM